MTKRSLYRPADNQSGGVSIYVSMVIMSIVMLITLSFVTIMVRNSRQTHQSQSNVQAYYAAETGIGDARARLLALFDAYGRGLKGVVPAKMEQIDANELGDLATALDSLALGAIPGKAVALRDNDSFVTSTNQGEVYLLTKGPPVPPPATPSWTSVQVSPPVTVTSDYGKTLATIGDCLFVGDPGGSRVYSFRHNGSSYTYRSTVSAGSNDELGYALAIAEAASVLAVGAPGASRGASSNEGVLYLYEYSPDCSLSDQGGSNPASLSLPPPGGASDRVGAAVAASGSRVAFAGPGIGSHGKVYVLYDIGDPPSFDGESSVDGSVGLNPLAIGESLAISQYYLAVGSEAISGTVRVYDYNAGLREWEFAKDYSGGNSFGQALALEGPYLAIGEPNSNKFYLYQYRAGNWGDDPVNDGTVPPPSVTETGPSGSSFGYSLSLKNKQLAIGASGLLPGVHMRVIRDVFDLTPEQLSDFLGINRCINKDNPDPEHQYRFDVGDNDAGIYYSCLSIELAPDVLYYDEMERDRSTTLNLKSIDFTTDDYAPLEGLAIRWANSDESGFNFNTTSFSQKFPPYSGWSNIRAPALEVQITPLNRTAGYDRDYLKDQSKVMYFYPTEERALLGPHVAYDPQWDSINSGDIIEARCGNYDNDNGIPVPENICIVHLKNLISPSLLPNPANPTTGDQFSFHIRIRSLYKPADIRINGYSYSYTTPTPPSNRMSNLKDRPDRRVRFRDIQAIIGATGHSQDVQVRLEERFRLQPAYAYPEAGILSSQSICKILISDQDTGTDTTGGSLSSGLTPPGTNVGQDCRSWQQ